ncbi:myelin-associated glycoprotein [Stigmatopora nigra]
MTTMPCQMLFLFFLFTIRGVETSSWTVVVPSSVNGLPGSCVVIPCSFNYPDPKKDIREFTGIWLEEENRLIYHPVGAMTMQQYYGRTELVGDIKQKNCSLKIEPLQKSDHGPFHFRIEMKDFENFSYSHKTVSVKMIRASPINLTVVKDTHYPLLIASCTVTHSCPTSPPVFHWSHSGHLQFRTRPLENGQWEATSILALHPAHANNNTRLQCRVTFKGGQQQVATKIINVRYEPVDVNVEYKANVIEGESVHLKCSSDANPPTTSYEWHNEDGARLHEGHIFILTNVSRRTGPLYCIAINPIGKTTSSPVQFDVTYAPEIKSVSSCSSEGAMVKCMCIAESRPPSSVHFFLLDRVLPRPDIERHDSVTIGTLKDFLPFYGFIQCVANNSLGNTNSTLTLPVYNTMLYIYSIVSAGAVIVVVILLIVIIKMW